MPKVTITRAHGTSLDDAKAKARELVQKFQDGYAKYLDRVDWSPDGQSATAKGKGFTAKFVIDARNIAVDIDLAFLLGMLAGRTETSVKKQLDDAFGPV